MTVREVREYLDILFLSGTMGCTPFSPGAPELWFITESVSEFVCLCTMKALTWLSVWFYERGLIGLTLRALEKHRLHYLWTEEKDWQYKILCWVGFQQVPSWTQE